MYAMDRGPWARVLVVATALTVFSSVEGRAQGFFRNPIKKDPAVKAASAEADRDKDKGDGTVRLIPKEVPVSPNDPIAIVNNQVITRQQLADETVAREGKKVLDAMIAGMLIDQSVAAAKLTITDGEINQEVAAIARGMGATPQDWLRTLDKERGISPSQYKRDIVYRIIALRRLAEPRVQVTKEDIQKAFEANYGEKLHYRMIMTASSKDANAIWNEVKENPASFEKIARDDRRSIDTETKPIGGLGLQPMARHAYPLELSKEVFKQLVDGDPNDIDPRHKPKDGDLTGPIQLAQSAFVIFRREKVDPAQPYDVNDEAKRKEFTQLLHEVKLKDMIQTTFNEMMDRASIENKLTGDIKPPKAQVTAAQTDGEVKLMTNPPPSTRSAAAVNPKSAGDAPQGVGSLNIPRPANAPRRPAPPSAPSEGETPKD